MVFGTDEVFYLLLCMKYYTPFKASRLEAFCIQGVLIRGILSLGCPD